MKKSRVHFVSVDDSDAKEAVKTKFARLLDGSDVFDFVRPADKVAVKVHFGEEENTGFVKPEYIKLACERILKKHAEPVVTDTNTLYKGRRSFTAEHLELAREHGFTDEAVAAPVVIADDTEEGMSPDVRIDQRFIKVAKVAPLFKRCDAIVSIAHFKGHLMTGFGGALKNIGMGCASREGKLAQHSDVAPFVNIKDCTGCAECEKVCPVQAISAVDAESHVKINISECIGCASCIAACPSHAIDVHWEEGAGNIQEKMVEYAKAALLGKEKKSAFVNFAIKITKECDCLAKDDPKISPDLGIFASLDPVSTDKASVDSIVRVCGKDIFREVHPLRDWSKQLEYAHRIGLGSLDYELVIL